MEYKDYYKILGINKTASQDEIKKAYRKLAMKFHPDKNPGNTEAENRFKEINEAHDVLGDREKRKKYDRLGENWKYFDQGANFYGGKNYGGDQSKQGQAFYYEGDINDVFKGFGGQGFSDFFEAFFRSGKNNSQFDNFTSNNASKGQDYEAEIDLTLEEAYFGSSRVLQAGNGKIRIKTKPGAYKGQVLRIKGKGGHGNSANGDIYIKINVLPHSKFSIEGNNLKTVHKINLFDAILGGKTIIETLSGKVQVKIPEGTQNNKVIKIKGKGMPGYDKNDRYGDLLVQLQVEVPHKLTKKQKELFGNLRQSFNY